MYSGTSAFCNTLTNTVFVFRHNSYILEPVNLYSPFFTTN